MKTWRKQLSRIFARGSIEANLKLLGSAGFILIATLVATLFYIQVGLVSSQKQLVDIALPIRHALGRLDTAVGDAFRRETQLSAARDAAQVKDLLDRSAIEQGLHEAHGQLLELWPRASTGAAHSGELRQLEESIPAFLATDAELSAAVERRHELQTQFDMQLSVVDKELRAAIEGAQAISGVLRLDLTVRLRQIQQALQATGRAPTPLVRELLAGSTRGTLDSAAELVDALLALDGLVGKTALASNRDTLTAIAANELAQNHLQITRALDVLQQQLQGNPALERLSELKGRYSSLSARIGDETQPQSLVQLRRQIRDEDARAAQNHELGVARARELTGAVRQLRTASTALATSSTSRAMRAASDVRLFSVLVAMVGCVMCLFLALRIRQSVFALRGQNRELQGQKDHLARSNQDLEGVVSERTAAAMQRERALQVVLDSMSDGLISADLDGTLRPERSQTVVEWLGEPKQVKVWNYLFPHDPALAAAFRVSFEQLVGGELPSELCVDQMPHALELDQRSFALSYQLMREGERLVSVVIAIRDVTFQVEAERAQRLAREHQRTLAFLLRDKRGFARMARECEALVTQVISSEDDVIRRRALHTLKGNSASFGLASVSELAHALETKLEEQGELSDGDGEQLHARWHESMVRLDEFVATAHDTYEIAEADLETVLRALRHRADYQDILTMVEAFRLEPADAPLRRLGAQARRLAREHSKSLQVQIVDNGIRIPPERFQPLFSAFVHAIRNAIDHGVEPSSERLAAGKPEVATLLLRVSKLADEYLVFEIADDGRGIDWTRVRERARARGLPADSPEALQEAILSAGFSTHDQGSALSGRGGGMSALRAVCQEMGGSVELQSTLGSGTTVRCIVRIPELQRAPSRRPSMVRVSLRAARSS